jgi:hypothetical protein
MYRWFRVLVCALLIPAYALAAGVVVHGPDATGILLIEGQKPPLVADAKGDADGDADEWVGLLLELGDTSDDMSDHCASAPAVLPRAPLPQAAVAGPLPQPAGRTLGTLLRPPRAA